MPPKRTSTSETPAITLDAIRQLVADSVATALKAQAANMANTDNTNKNTGTSGTPIARKGINNHKRKFEDRGNTTNNSIEDKKLLGLILPKITMETALCVQDAPCITQEFALSSVEIATSLCDESLIIPKKEIWLDDKLNYMEESVEIMDREIKQLRRRCIPIVKVRWNSEFTWEREDQIRAKYPHLFSNINVSLN
ncbi:hypothetical protein Tco_1164194 [Tanacetum coccineum]